MSSGLIVCFLCVFIFLMLCSFRFLFILLLLLDLLGALVTQLALFSSDSIFIVLLVLMVLSNVLGMVLLIINMRNVGSDGVVFFL